MAARSRLEPGLYVEPGPFRAGHRRHAEIPVDAPLPAACASRAMWVLGSFGFAWSDGLCGSIRLYRYREFKTNRSSSPFGAVARPITLSAPP